MQQPHGGAERTGGIRRLVEAEQGRGDEGSFSPLLYARLMQFGWRVLSAVTHSPWTVAGVATAVAIGVGARLEQEPPSANLRTAETKAEIDLIAFDEAPRISVTRAVFDETMSAQDIKFKIPRRFARDLSFSGNLELQGRGETNFEVPLSALSQRRTAKGIVVVIDPEQVVATTAWQGTGPEIRWYTVDHNKKNFDDQENLWHSVLDVEAAARGILNVDGLRNAMTKVEDGAKHDMSLRALGAFGEHCVPQLDQRLRDAIINGITLTVARLGRSGDLAGVEFADGPLDWRPEAGDPTELPRGDRAATYRFGKFAVDEVTCNVDATQGGRP